MKLLSIFSRKRSIEEARTNVICVRCTNNLTMYEACCIIGHDYTKRSYTKDECREVICGNCAISLKFTFNAIAGSGGVVPTIFWNRSEIEQLHQAQREIYARSTRRKQNRRKGRLKHKRVSRNKRH